MTRKTLAGVAVVTACLVLSIAASAAQLTVASYAMNNGAMGGYDYTDFTYLPCPGNSCDTTNAYLSGGTGKLTDGVSPSLSWDQYGLLTPWVGWDRNQGQLNPTVTFNFGGPVTVNSVTVWLDNSIGNGSVFLPDGFSVNGTYFAIAPDYINPAPRGYTLSGLNISGSSVDVQFFQSSLGYQWVMVGEVTFNGTPTPEPTTMALTGGGLLLAWWRRRKA
jgi:hypothetical protein